MEEKKSEIKVMCTRAWECGFYKSFSEARASGFMYCQLCGCFLMGRESP